MPSMLPVGMDTADEVEVAVKLKVTVSSTSASPFCCTFSVASKLVDAPLLGLGLRRRSGREERQRAEEQQKSGCPQTAAARPSAGTRPPMRPATRRGARAARATGTGPRRCAAGASVAGPRRSLRSCLSGLGAGRLGAAAAAGAAAVAPSGSPQLGQNFESAGTVAPHLGQVIVAVRLWPQLGQNLLPKGMSSLQLGQRTFGCAPPAMACCSMPGDHHAQPGAGAQTQAGRGGCTHRAPSPPPPRRPPRLWPGRRWPARP